MLMSRVAISSVLLGTWLAALSSGAVDGVIEINQASALAGGITSGDGAGFPVTLSQSGSYRLTGSLSAGAKSAIVITTGAVTLDLNGFRLTGAAGPAAPGIDAVGQKDIRVSNGTVELFPGDGIRAGERARIEKVHSIGNTGKGISVSHLSSVTGCNVANSSGDGIQTGEVSIISSNIVELSVGDGIFASGRSAVTGNSVNASGRDGISSGNTSVVSDNVVTHSGSNGILAGSGNTIRHNVVRFNVLHGIKMASTGTLIGNTIIENLRCGVIVTSGQVGWAHNVVVGNNGDVKNRQATGALNEMTTGSPSDIVFTTNFCSNSLAGFAHCENGPINNCP